MGLLQIEKHNGAEERRLLVALRLLAAHGLVEVTLTHDDPAHGLVVPPSPGLIGVVAGNVGNGLVIHGLSLHWRIIAAFKFIPCSIIGTLAVEMIVPCTDRIALDPHE
jgi:hypothetical protein